jgi:hypothetical protein
LIPTDIDFPNFDSRVAPRVSLTATNEKVKMNEDRREKRRRDWFEEESKRKPVRALHGINEHGYD